MGHTNIHCYARALATKCVGYLLKEEGCGVRWQRKNISIL